MRTNRTTPAGPLFRTLRARGRWVPAGGGRYLLRGDDPTVVVVLGFSRRWGTFYARVWEVPPDAPDYRDGELLLWVGAAALPVVEVKRLAEKLAGFVAVPWDLLRALEDESLGNPTAP